MKPKTFLIMLLLVVAIAATSCFAVRKSKASDSIQKLYPEIKGEGVFEFASKDDVLSMLRHGTGIVFFSWDECKWCHYYISVLNEAATRNDITILYYDIHDDRDKGNEFYKSVLDLLSESLDESGAYDATGTPRVYVPDVTFVVEGKIVHHDNESSMLDSNINVEEYWAETADNGQTRGYNLRHRLNTWSDEICEALLKIEGRGCEKCAAGCETEK